MILSLHCLHKPFIMHKRTSERNRYRNERKETQERELMQIREYLKTSRLITDGAMGTYFESLYPGTAGMPEYCNLTDPDKIEAIHRAYIESGARLIRTNTFAANGMFFEDMDEVEKVIRAGYQIAEDAVRKSGQDVFIAADMGQIVDQKFCGEKEVCQEYFKICDIFEECGAEIFMLETLSDFIHVCAVAEYIKQKNPDYFVIAQFSVDKSGYTRSGLGIENIIRKAAECEAIDAYGFNCGVGAAHLGRLLESVEFPNDKYVTALPNAGYPVTLRGRTVYGDNRRYYVEQMEQIAALGIEILGGCCGTTPEYIHRLSEKLKNKPSFRKKIADSQIRQEGGKGLPLEKKLNRGEKLYIVELDPPFDTDISKVMNGAAVLKDAGADLLTLADSPMARTRMDAGKLAAKVQREIGISVMPHICCRDKNVIAMRSGILGDYMNDLRHFLIITGDPVGRESKGAVTPVFDFNSIRFMEYVSQMNEEVFAEEPVLYGGALNYHGANPDAICRRVRQKMEKGCRMFLTQPIYSPEDIARISYIREQTGAKIMCGIMPLVSYKNARFMANEMPGIRIPDEVVERYRPDMTREEAEQVGVDLAAGLAEEMKDIADGYYFMTPFNRAGMIAKILQKIRNGQEEQA